MSDYNSMENCMKRLTQNMEICEFLMDKSKTIPHDIYTNIMEDGVFVFYGPGGYDLSVEHIKDPDIKDKARKMLALFQRICVYDNIE